MRLGCVTDEIALDISEAIYTGVQEDIRHYELRFIETHRFPFYPPRYVEHLKEYKQKHGLIYTAASPGIFKLQHPSESFRNSSTASYTELFNLAHELKIPTIHIFAYKECGDNDQYVQMIDDIRSFTKLARKENLTVCLENSASTCCRSGEDTVRLIEEIGMDNLGINWDPGNAVLGGATDYQEGYRWVKQHLRNVHVKDIILGEDKKPRFVPIGDGIIDYKGQIRNLKQDGYDGPLVIETHCKPSRNAFLKSVSYLKELLASAVDNTRL